MIAALAGGGWLLATLLAVSARWATASRATGVARACHELRGPLCALGLGVELANRTGRLPSARLRALELELGRAKQALDDLTVAGGVRARAHPTRTAAPPVGLGALIREAAEAWRDAAGTRSIRVELPSGGEVFVAGERLRLAQALCNLLANAVEHGEGDVVMRLRAGGGIARIEIRDGGRGLPVPLVQLIGSGHLRRRRTWPTRTRVSERGHGLRIVVEVARSHGGRVISAPSDRGALLVLELPLSHAGSGRRAAV